MATIIIRNSTGSGVVPSSLVQGELAINTKDGRLFYGSGSSNVVKEFTGSGGGGTTFPYTGSAIITGSLILTGSAYLTDSIYFSGSGPASRLVWNDTDGTLNLGLKGGVVSSELGQGLVTRIVNKTVPNIYLSGSNYQVVVVAGAQGQRLAVKLAQADNDANSAGTLGIVAENIDKNQEGFIVTVGLLKNRDTTGALQGETWSDGDVLYLSPTTAGAITNIKPQAPQHTVIVGYVEYAHANNGKIYVKIDNGYELDELHNVRITTASLIPGQLLVRSGSNNSGVWINTNQLTGSYGLTGSLQATSFTGSLQGTASWATNAANAAAVDVYVFGSPVESYLLMSNVVGTTGVAVGGDADLRYNSSTNKLTVGSVSATSFTGSLIGTASWATNALTASIAETAISALTSSTILTIRESTNATYYPTFVDSNNAVKAAENVYTNRDFVFNPGTTTFSAPIIAASLGFTGSLTGSLLGTASYAVQALSASWAPGGGSAFPYIGTAVITGSLIVSGANGGINTSLGFPVLFQNDGVNTVTFGNGKLWLNDSVGGTSIDWGNRYLLDTSGTTKADWEQSYLADGNAITRVDWGNGALNDSAGTAAFDWESRRMIDIAGARSADFDTRFLIYPNGTTAAINYGTQGQIAMTGSVSITGSLTVSGSSTFTNIGPAIFTGSVSSLNGFTGSLQGTASWATNARTASFLSAGTYNITAQNANNIYISTNSTPGTYTIPVYTAGGEDSNNSIASSNASYDQTNGHFTMTVLSSSLFGTASWATNARTASFVNTLNQDVIVSGSIDINNGGKLTVNAVGGDEGGEILLGKAVTNTTLTGSGVTIDVYQNKLRIFEQGGNTRGGYYDITTLGSGVGTNLSPIRNIQNTTDGTAVTGTTSNTLTKSILIPANTVGVGDVLYIKSRARKTGTAGTLIVRMYINTSAAIGGSLIATSATNAATNVYFQYTRTAIVKTTTNTETMAGNLNVNADDNVAVTTAVSANNIDWTVAQYLVIAHANSSAADSSVNSFAHIQINKA